MQPLRLVVYDATQAARPPQLLGVSWKLGARLYQHLGWVDAEHGARSFPDMLEWLASFEPERPIGEVQFWGHGKWGRSFIDRDTLDRSALRRNHVLHAGLVRVKRRLTSNALLWFRTCETLGAHSGQRFASELADFMGARVAGHTFVIGFFQSGLHCLQPGARPHWAPDEGLCAGTPADPRQARNSSPWAPSTITCLTPELPAHCGAGPPR